MLKEIKQLETRLEKQISNTNALERELEELKQENLSLKSELKGELHSNYIFLYFFSIDLE